MNKSFDDYSFFSGDTLLHTEVPCRPYGFAETATPFLLRNDGWSGLLLLLSLFLASILVLRLRKKFTELVRNIFLSISGKTDEPILDDPLRYSTRLIAIFLLSLTAAIVTFAYTQYDVSYYPFPETPYIIIVAFFIFWLGYFLMKRLMGNFVNWIFFRREKIFTWKRACTFLYVAESMFFFILTIVVMYLHVSLIAILFMALALVTFVKIVLLFKTYQIFFSKMYGILHLIVYFCTLELIPLFVSLQILTSAGWLSTVKL